MAESYPSGYGATTGTNAWVVTMVAGSTLEPQLPSQKDEGSFMSVCVVVSVCAYRRGGGEREGGLTEPEPIIRQDLRPIAERLRPPPLRLLRQEIRELARAGPHLPHIIAPSLILQEHAQLGPDRHGVIHVRGVGGEGDGGVEDGDEVLVVRVEGLDEGDHAGVGRGGDGEVAEGIVDVDVAPLRLEGDVRGAHGSDIVD